MRHGCHRGMGSYKEMMSVMADRFGAEERRYVMLVAVERLHGRRRPSLISNCYEDF